MSETVTLTLARGRRRRRVDATRVHFSAHQCFRFDDHPDEIACLRRLGAHLKTKPGLAVYGDGPLLDHLLRETPELTGSIAAIIRDPGSAPPAIEGVPVATPDALPAAVRTVFLCETQAYPRQRMRQRLSGAVETLDADILVEIARELIPERAWTPVVKHIYPVVVPDIRFETDLDMVLIDCPARNLALMPNGLGYVHNVLKKLPIRFQTFDLDIATYHRYHMHRLFDAGGKIVLPNGREMPTDPWQAENYDLWSDAAVIDYFMPTIDEAAEAIIRSKPKILGLSVQQCNEAFSRALVNKVRQARPDTVILVGGFSCYNAEIGLRAFPEADYMCIGEADLTIGPLVQALARGERPRNQAGVLSKYDTPGFQFAPAPMPHNLDQLDFPKYEWCDLNLYRNYNGYQLVPIIASRGCRWSRCTFCAERFYWRIRSAKNFVDELEWLVQQGCTLFMFNESDLNGMPEKVLEMCDEIIRRGLKVKLTGQLRIHKKSDRAYFRKLREAGFVALRFGVDAFSENTLRLQKKGYTTEMLSQNLKDCWEAGIYTEVNWVIGVPGETEADCDEGIRLILANRQYIGRLANINPLILSTGSVYWIDPDAHNIKFRGDPDELKAKYPRAIPADLWYSVEPFIDAQVRKARFERIVLALHDANFPVGAWAHRIIQDVKLARDRNRAGAADEHPPAAGPRLVRELATHTILYRDGIYYAVPLALGDVTQTGGDLASLPGVVTDTSEAALVVEIEHASDWANSRGHYDARARQQRGGTYFRAGSNMAEFEPQAGAPAPKSEILAFDGELYAVEPQVLDELFTRPAASDAAEREAKAARASAQISVTPLRRAVRLLPAPITAELRRLWRARQFQPAPEAERPADIDIVRTVVRGMVAEYVRLPVARLFSGERRPPGPRGTAVPGRDCTIVASVTKGATPDLLSSVDAYNVVQFDGRYYACPHGTVIDWESGEAASLPGVFVADTAKGVMAHILAMRQRATAASAATQERGSGPAGDISAVPVHLGAVSGYNMVTYEGWVFGIPQALGDVDLAEIDVMELPGVIRDVSRDVVESEILDRRRAQDSVAAE